MAGAEKPFIRSHRADGDKRRRGKGGGAKTPPLALALELPVAMFTGPGLLALADLLPVMTAYLDRDLKYRFIHKPLAEWLEQPRREMIGKLMREAIGDKAFEERIPMLESVVRVEWWVLAAA